MWKNCLLHKEVEYWVHSFFCCFRKAINFKNSEINFARIVFPYQFMRNEKCAY